MRTPSLHRVATALLLASSGELASLSLGGVALADEPSPPSPVSVAPPPPAAPVAPLAPEPPPVVIVVFLRDGVGRDTGGVELFGAARASPTSWGNAARKAFRSRARNKCDDCCRERCCDWNQREMGRRRGAVGRRRGAVGRRRGAVGRRRGAVGRRRVNVGRRRVDVGRRRVDVGGKGRRRSATAQRGAARERRMRGRAPRKRTSGCGPALTNDFRIKGPSPASSHPGRSP
jgi:hypothetical protein